MKKEVLFVVLFFFTFSLSKAQLPANEVWRVNAVGAPLLPGQPDYADFKKVCAYPA